MVASARRQQHRVQVLVAGAAIDAPAIRHNPQSFQAELAEAKSRFGSALCRCQSPFLPLVIRERVGKRFLAAWPDQAGRHALDCPFFSEPDGVASAAVRSYAPGSIQDDGDVTRLTLKHQLTHAARHVLESKGACPQTGPTDSDAKRCGIHTWGLLHHLWEAAGLNRWHPGWHRDWGFVRYAIRRAAENTIVEDRPLLESIYIPPVWVRKRQDQIKEGWAQFRAPLLRHHRKSDLVVSGLVIGTVRSIEPSEFGNIVKLHHHADPFFMDQYVSDNANRHSRRGWSAAKHLEMARSPQERPFVVAAMRVEAAVSGRMVIVEAALMRVSPRFIPVNSSYEDHLARLLVEQDRRFIRPLHYDNHNIELPHFILRDTVVDPIAESGGIAMFVYGTASSDVSRLRAQREHAKFAANHSMGYWKWDASQDAEPPPLPCVSTTPVSIASSPVQSDFQKESSK